MRRSTSIILPTALKPIEGPVPVWRSTSETTQTTHEALQAVERKSYAAAIVNAEKLVGDNNLRPIGFLQRGVMLSRPVCLVEVTDSGCGTGFLVGPGVVMTNHHVIPSVEHAARTRLRFDFEEDVDGHLKPSRYFPCQPDQLFFTNPALDYTIVGVAGAPEQDYGCIPITPGAAPVVGSRVNIIQHPAAEPKQIACVDNEVEYVDGQITQYLTDTLPGSSGAPVFDDEWRLVALHHSGGWLPNPSDSSTHFRNEGIVLDAILADLMQNGLVQSA